MRFGGLVLAAVMFTASGGHVLLLQLLSIMALGGSLAHRGRRRR
jgi:hypothetical protein